MHQHLTVLLALSAFGSAQAQPTFNRMYGGAYPLVDVGGCTSSVELDSMIYFVSTEYNYDAFAASAVMRMIDLDGDLLFESGFTDTIRGYRPQTLAAVPDGSGFIAGGFRPTYTPADSFMVGLMIRYDLSGDTLWTKEFIISDSSFNQYYPYGLNMDSDGRFVIAGTVVLDFVPPDDQPGQIYLLKADASGNKLWEHVYGQPSIHEMVYDVENVPADHGYMIVGAQFEYYSPSWDLITPFIIRTDSFGAQIYYEELTNAFSQAVTNIVLLSDGNYLLGGGACSSNEFQYDGSLTKIDANSNIQWSRRFDRLNVELHEEFTDVIELTTGDFVISGSSRDTSDLSQGGWILKTDDHGYLLWERFFNHDEYTDYFQTITALSDGGILATGNCYDTVGMSQNVWLVKLDSLGCDSAGCPDAYFTSVPNLRPIDGIYLVAAPNPFKGATEIRWAWPALARKCELLIHDLSGREVLRKELDPNVARGALRLEAPGAGAYVVSLVADGQLLQGMKLVCE